MDLDENKYYIIKNTSNGKLAQWEDETILFDTIEEVEEIVILFPDFFKPSEIEVKKVIIYADHKINYKDLKQRKDFIEEVKKLRGEDNNG
jgi:hypothetical protein